MIRPALLTVAIAASGAPYSPIAAGRWVITNQIEHAAFDGHRSDTAFPKAAPRSVCLTAADAAKGPGLVFVDPSRCKILERTVAHGDFAFETRCQATESSDTIVTRTSGRYEAGSYTGQATSMQRRGSSLIEMRSTIVAKRVGDC